MSRLVTPADVAMAASLLMDVRIVSHGMEFMSREKFEGALEMFKALLDLDADFEVDQALKEIEEVLGERRWLAPGERYEETLTPMRDLVESWIDREQS